MELHESSQVVKNLLRKRDLLLEGDRAHEEIRSGLIICGGAQRGVDGASRCLALQLLGLHQCFDVVVGTSTGALIGAFFLDDITRGTEAVAFYYRECLDKRFINPRSWPMVNLDFIEEHVLRGGRRPINVDGMLRHRSHFFATATCWVSGRGHLLDVKAGPDPIKVIKASSAIPELYRKPVRIGEKNFTDGSYAMPFPAKEVVERFGLTDLLVVANCSETHLKSYGTLKRRALTNLFALGLPSVVRNAALLRSELWAENLAYLQNSEVNVEILWGPDYLDSMTRDPSLLMRAAEEGVRKTLAVFGQSEIPFNLL